MFIQLEKLLELQKLDQIIEELEINKIRFPEKVKDIEEEIESAKKRREEQKEKIEEMEKERRKKENQLEMEIEKIKKAKQKLNEVKTNKEYQAALKEIEILEETKDEMEISILQMLEDIDSLKTDFIKGEEEFKKRNNLLIKEKQELLEKINMLDTQIAETKKNRERVIKEIEPELEDMYEFLKQRKDGPVIVQAVRETCLGCNMHIPPQLFNEVIKNERIITCPNCHCILYYKKPSEKVVAKNSKRS